MSDWHLHGVIVVDKPPGEASNRALGRLKRLLGITRRRGKIGFLGTLDPLATGVLPVFVGKATKLIPAFEGLDKTYRVTMRLGQRTDTFDAEGTVTEEHPLGDLTADRVREAVCAFAGTHEQAAPAFSAVKQGGVPAYRLARAGQAVQRRVRTVHVRDVAVEAVALPEATFTCTVSAGTYVRSLVDDIGGRLGVGAHVTALRRTACGTLFTEQNSFTLDRIASCIDREDVGFVQNPADFLVDYTPLTVDAAAERHLRDGRTLPLPGGASGPETKAKALGPDGTLVAIGRVVPLQGAATARQQALGFQPTKVLV